MNRTAFPSLLLAALLLAAPAARAFDLRARTDGTNTVAYAADTRFDSETLLAGYDIANSATADKDLWLFAQSVRQDGTAGQDARIVAKSSVIDGLTKQNLMVFAQAAQLTTNAQVRGDLLMYGKALVCEGAVGGRSVFFGDEVTLSGEYGGDVRVIADTIRLSPGTHVAGDFVYTCPTAFAPPPGVRIDGQVRAKTETARPVTLRERLSLRGMFFIGALLAGLPFVGFFPRTAGASVRAIGRQPWRCLFTGMAMLFLAPVALCFAAVTVVGLPFALVAGLFWLVTLYLSHIVIALYIGHLLTGRNQPQTFSRVFLAMGTGLFILYFASAFPAIAGFLAMPVVVLGLGALWCGLLFSPAGIAILPPVPRDTPSATAPPPPPPPAPPT